MPDAVLVKGTRLWLVETESAPKATAELIRIVSQANASADACPELPYTLAGVVVVFDATLNHAARIAKAARERWGHPNPTHGKKTHRWNGKTPAEASKELGARWQAVRRDLAKKGLTLSGLWAAEPHGDGCPHKHFWLLYAPEHQREVFAAC